MKSVLAPVALAAAMMPAVCFSAVAAEPTIITVAGYSGVFQDGYTEAVIKPFEAANPDIKIKYFPSFNSAQLVGSLVAQKAAPEVDVVIMDLVASKGASDQGIFEQLDPSTVASINELMPEARFEGVAGAAVTFDFPVMIYNPKVVSPAPTSWNAFWDEKYAGQLGISQPPGLLGVAFTIIQDRAAGGTDDLAGLDKGIEKLATLAPAIKSFEAKDWYPTVASGEVALALGWNARAQVYAEQTNGAVLPAIPDDGLVRQVNTINLVQDAPHRDAALKFINYALGAEAQSAVVKRLRYGPTNARVSLSEEDRQKAGLTSRSQVYNVDWIKFAAVNATMTQQWRRKIVTAQGR